MIFLRALGLFCRSVYHIHTPHLILMSEVSLVAIIIDNGCSFWFFTVFQSFAWFLEQVQSFSLIVAVCHATALAKWERQGVPFYICKPSIRLHTKQANKLTVSKRTYVCVSGGNEKGLGMLCFFETPILRFALLPYYRRSIRLKNTFFISLS